ncbi:hypothetical protein Tco_0649488 [Tanacetum coccineum]
MAAPGAGNQVARRVIDDVVAFSGETSVQEAQTARNMIGQLNALIAKMEALDDTPCQGGNARRNKKGYHHNTMASIQRILYEINK